MKSLSILLLGTQMATGGAQKLLLDQARWFDAHGHKVTIAFIYDRDNLFHLWKESISIPIHNLKAFDRNSGFIKQTLLFISGTRKLWSLLRREKFDAVITYTHDSNTIGLPLAWLTGVRVRIGTHLGVIRDIPKWREKLHAILVNIGCIQTLIAASKGTMQNAIKEGVSPSKIQVIPNGVDFFEVHPGDREKVRKKLHVKEHELLLVAVGRLVYEKGHEFLIKAMVDVVKEFPNAKAVICGIGSLHDELSALIKSHSLENHVQLIGLWDDIPQLLSAADMFVLPSRWEGLSIALLEGMMAELPILATKVEGVEEALQDGVNGLLVAPGDSQALSRGILQLLSNPEMREQMGQAAHQQVLQGYTINAMCEQYLKVMEKHLE
jgi:glycosyltransferase involved in cell wall biosynthesis